MAGSKRDLRLGVLGDHGERRREVVDEQPLGLLERVDVAVEAVALVGELLHQVVVVVAHAVADGDEVDALLAGLGDLLGKHGRIGRADVGDAVGGQHDDVEGGGVEGGAGLLVAEHEAGLHVRAAARAELVDGGDDALGVSRPWSAPAPAWHRRRR